MKKNMNSFRLGLGLLAALFYMGCEDEPTPSLLDLELDTRPTPVITSAAPTDTFAVIGTVIINGSNFSGAIEENFVYFDDQLGAVLEASPTQLRVRTPKLVKSDVKLKIAKYKADKFSNVINYNLRAAVEEFYDFPESDQPWAIASDAEGNVFVSYVNTQVSAESGVSKITSELVRSRYAPKPSGSPTRYNGMKVGPGGFLYGVTFERRISQIPVSGGTALNWVVIPNPPSPAPALRLADLDFDRVGNLWAAGNVDLYCVKPDKSWQKFPFVGTVRSVRIFNDAVYLAGNRDGTEKIWRVPIVSADAVGPEEEYFDFSAKYSGAAQAITFAADGDLYIGTDSPESLVVVHPDKSTQALYDGLFPTPALSYVRASLFPAPVLSFAWGTDNFLYVTQEANTTAQAAQTILTVNMLKKGAPYYGRGDN